MVVRQVEAWMALERLIAVLRATTQTRSGDFEIIPVGSSAVQEMLGFLALIVGVSLVLMRKRHRLSGVARLILAVLGCWKIFSFQVGPFS